MKSCLKFLLALAIALVIMLTFRALVFTIYTVPDSTMEPTFKAGDRVMVNRWSYGLRTGDDGLFSYGRLCRQPIDKGDWLAVDDSLGRVVIGRCTAVPGDTIRLQERTFIVPGRTTTCAHHDYYLVDPIGLVREQQIIGRVFIVVYNHTPGRVIWHGNDPSRVLLPL